jgi:hypothetical protein
MQKGMSFYNEDSLIEEIGLNLFNEMRSLYDEDGMILKAPTIINLPLS